MPLQHPAVYPPVTIPDNQHHQLVKPIHLAPRPVVEAEPVHLYPITVPSNPALVISNRPPFVPVQESRPVGVNPGHLYPVGDSPTPGVVVDNRPSYTPGHLVPSSQHEDTKPQHVPESNVPSNYYPVHPVHYYPGICTIFSIDYGLNRSIDLNSL